MNQRLRTIWTCCITFVLANASHAAGYDPSFDGDGRLTLGLSPANALTAIQQPDGKLVIAGTSGEALEEIDMLIVRLNSDGSRDTSFGGGDGTVEIDYFGNADRAMALLLQPDGKLVVAGDTRRPGDVENGDFAFARLNADGTLDGTFGGGGKTTVHAGGTDRVQGLALQPDGKLVAAGETCIGCTGAGVFFTFSTQFAFLRLNTDGTLDQSFGSNGVTSIGFAPDAPEFVRFSTLLQQPNGALTAVGWVGAGELTSTEASIFMARVTQNGAPDTSFDGDGRVIHDYSTRPDIETINDALLLGDGKYLVAGSFGGFNTSRHSLLTRINADGSLDATFGAEGRRAIRVATSDAFSDIALTAEGKLVASGVLNQQARVNGAGGNFASLFVMRMSALAVPDEGFAPGGIARLDIGAAEEQFYQLEPTLLLVQDDGRLVVYGTNYNLPAASRPDISVFRLLPDSLGAAGEVSLGSLNTGGFESDGDITLIVQRTGGSNGAATVHFRTLAGSATATADFAPVTGSLEWADGDATFRHIVVPIAADKVAEDSEAFRVELHDASGGVTIGSAQATVSISDDDDGTAGFIDVSRRPSPVLESDGSVMLRFTRVYGSTGPVSVTFSTIPVTASEPADYAATSGTVSWADGESGAKEVAVAIPDDSEIEIPEIFDTDIVSGTGGVGFHPTDTFAHSTVEDDDNPIYSDDADAGGGSAGSLGLTQGVVSVDERAGSANLTVTRTGGSEGAVTVRYEAVAGSAEDVADFSVVTGTLSWEDGESAAKEFSVPIVDDDVADPGEMFTIHLSDATGNAYLARVVSTVQIDDDESPPGELAVSLAALVVDEGDGTVTIEVMRSDGSDGEVSIDYVMGGGTATSGSDFTAASGTLTWQVGDSGTKEISVAITDDTIEESDENFTITLSNPTGGATLGGGSTTVTITDDDSAGGSGDNDSGGGGGGGCFLALLLSLLSAKPLRRRVGAIRRSA